LNRPVSPLLHDYKSSDKVEIKKIQPLHWFAVGLGLPLLGIALLLTLRNAAGNNPQQASGDDATVAVEAETPPTSTEQLTADIELDPAGISLAAFHPPMWLEPQFEQLQLTVKRGDTLDRLFRKNKLSIANLAAIVRLSVAAPYLKKLIPGDELQIEHDDGELVSLYRELSLTSALKVSKAEIGYSAEIIDRPIEIHRKLSYGKIDSSLFESAVDAGLPDELIMNLAGIFAWDVDFVLDIRSGDDYYVLFEQIFQDGEYVSDGAIIAAEFNNNGRTIQAIRYTDKNGRADYFTPEGQSIRKAFLRAPVDFRVSSSFNPNRRHPVLKTVRPHRGTDYAAPSGTPIKAAGDGKVNFRGVKSGYGNVVILQHGGNITTLYAHMSKFASKVRNGTRVRQGQTIGYVGKTGLVTGVHLHYEYRLNGVHRNPRTVKLPQAEPIKDEYRQDFLSAAEPILNELLRYKRTQVASLSID
jgi:murein DD-endopeptidase MepM/ murein hydrolase activator NlpD